MVLLYSVAIVYLLAVNVYGFFLVKSQKEIPEGEKADYGKLFIAGILGGAIAVYTGLFVFRFRLKSPLLMILMPVLAVLNVYFAIWAFRSGAGWIAARNAVIP